MKKIFILLVLSLNLNGVFAQNKTIYVDDIIGGPDYNELMINGTCSVYNEEAGDDSYYEFSIEQLNAILQNDVIVSNGLEGKYKSPLQRDAFMETEEAAKLLKDNESLKQQLKSKDFYVFYEMKKMFYDPEAKAFTWSDMYSDIRFCQETGYYCAGKLMFSYPQNLVSIIGSDYGSRGYYYTQRFYLPKLPTAIALKIEENIENVRLLLKVKMVKAKTIDKHGFFERNFIFLKTTNAYLINLDGLEEVYCDLTPLLFPHK